MSGGAVTEEIVRAEATPERVGAAMTAHRTGEAA
jgi:ribose transport system ATP-binding protein/rhamnose transport system ATP-binding protein